MRGVARNADSSEDETNANPLVISGSKKNLLPIVYWAWELNKEEYERSRDASDEVMALPLGHE